MRSRLHERTSRSSAPVLLVGDGLSAFASWVDFLAILSLAAYHYHVSAYEMGLVSAAALLPGILLGKQIGALCDRGSPKAVLLVSIAGRVVCTGGILLLGRFEIFLLMIGLRSVFASVAPPAINVLAVRAIETESRARFFSILNVINSAAKIVAPALGTVSSSLSSESLVLLVSAAFSAASFIVFALLPSVRRVGPPEGDAAGESTGSGGERGARLAPLLLVGASYAFYTFMVNNLVPLALERSGQDKALLGVLVSAAGTGNILSGLWLARAGKSSRPVGSLMELTTPAWLHAIGFSLIGVVLYAKPGATAYLLAALFFAIGLVSTRFAIALSVFLTTNYGDRTGTASAWLQSSQNVMILLAPMVGAVVLDQAGPAALFWAAAATAVGLFGSIGALGAAGRFPVTRLSP